MSTRDIGWIDKDKMDDTLRSLKERQRKRRTRTPQSTASEEETYTNLLGEEKASGLPSANKEAQESSLLLPESAHAPETAAQPAAAASTAAGTQQRDAARSTAPSAITQPIRPPAAPETPASTGTSERSTTPTAKLVTTPNVSEEYTDPAQQNLEPRGEPRIPGTRPAATHTAAYTTHQRDTATLETTPTRAQEPDDSDLALRFQDAFDVLRSADSHRPQDRYPTHEITPTPEHAGDLELGDNTPSKPSKAPAGADLALQSTGDDNQAAPRAFEDLQLEATDTFSDLPTSAPSAVDEDDEPFSLPAHDLDLSLQTSAQRVPAMDDTPDTQDLSDVLVFESEDFADDHSASTDTQPTAPLHIQDLGEQTSIAPEATVATTSPSADPAQELTFEQTPEHPYVPKIHSQILKTVRLRTAPDPAQSDTLYQWLQAFHTWIQNAESPSTQFLVADASGLSLLETGADPHSVALAAATRQTVSEQKPLHEQNAAGFTAVAHEGDRYMNLVWSPSQHGTITLGIISDQAYPGDRLAGFQEKLSRAIASMPFI